MLNNELSREALKVGVDLVGSWTVVDWRFGIGVSLW